MNSEPKFQRLNTALVGAGYCDSGGSDRISERDHEMLQAFQRMAEFVWREAALFELVPDIINLWHGRDFLKEDKTYDAVVTCSCMHLPMPLEKWGELVECLCLSDKDWHTQVSERHEIEQWRARLIATRARCLYIAHPIRSSLDGDALGEIDGYMRLKDPHGYKATVYLREDS